MITIRAIVFQYINFYFIFLGSNISFLSNERNESLNSDTTMIIDKDSEKIIYYTQANENAGISGVNLILHQKKIVMSTETMCEVVSMNSEHTAMLQSDGEKEITIKPKSIKRRISPRNKMITTTESTSKLITSRADLTTALQSEDEMEIKIKPRSKVMTKESKSKLITSRADHTTALQSEDEMEIKIKPRSKVMTKESKSKLITSQADLTTALQSEDEMEIKIKPRSKVMTKESTSKVTSTRADSSAAAIQDNDKDIDYEDYNNSKLISNVASMISKSFKTSVSNYTFEGDRTKVAMNDISTGALQFLFSSNANATGNGGLNKSCLTKYNKSFNINNLSTMLNNTDKSYYNLNKSAAKVDDKSQIMNGPLNFLFSKNRLSDIIDESITINSTLDNSKCLSITYENDSVIHSTLLSAIEDDSNNCVSFEFDTNSSVVDIKSQNMISEKKGDLSDTLLDTPPIKYKKFKISEVNNESKKENSKKSTGHNIIKDKTPRSLFQSSGNAIHAIESENGNESKKLSKHLSEVLQSPKKVKEINNMLTPIKYSTIFGNNKMTDLMFSPSILNESNKSRGVTIDKVNKNTNYSRKQNKDVKKYKINNIFKLKFDNSPSPWVSDIFCKI